RRRHEDRPLLDRGRVAADLDGRVIGVGPRGHVPAPAVPGTDHDLALHVPLAQRSAPVRAEVVDRVVAARHVEHGDALAVHLNGPRLALAELADRGDLRPVRHSSSPAPMAPLPDIGRRRRLATEPAARDVRPWPWASIENFERGAPVLDTGSAETAARELALAEDRVVFYGDPAGSGFLTNRKSPRITTHDWSRPGQVLADLVKAVET